MRIDNLLQKLAKPAQRAIQSTGITTIEKLTKYGEEDISKQRGIVKNEWIL